MNIREATLYDIPELLRMTKNFYNASHFPELALYSEKTMEQMLSHYIMDRNGVLLVAEGEEGLVGTVLILIFPYFFNHNVLTAQDLWWWVEPEARGTSVGVKMFKQAEQQVKDRGVIHLTMMSMESSSADKVDKIYRKMGFNLIEHSYIKELV